MDALIRNLSYAIRGLARTPAFTLTVVLTLALGIGANTTVFSAIDAVLLRDLPYANPDRLVRLNQTNEGAEGVNVAPVRLEDWKRLNATFEVMHGYLTTDVADMTGELPERVRVANVTEGFLDTWGVAPALGRGFAAEEHLANGPRAIIVSDRYWRTRLGADPGALGREVRTKDGSYSIVGVMPAGLIFPDRTVDAWSPIATDNPFAADTVQNRYLAWYQVIGRLRPGVTLDGARADLSRVQAALADRFPDSDGAIRVGIEPLSDALLGGARASLWLLFGAVTVLLLIACTNIAALLLARATQHEHEIAVRFSLGASRMAVAAQLLTEAGVLAFAGAAAGLVVAMSATSAFRALVPDLPRIESVTLDGRVLLYTTVTVVVVALLCGLIPALRGTRESHVVLRPARIVSPRQSLPWLLVGVQVALSVTLLVGAGLLLRSLDALTRVDPGFEPSGVLAFRITGDFAETGDFPRFAQRLYGTINELAALPGIASAAISATELPGVPGIERGFQVAAQEVDLVEGRDEGLPPMFAELRVVTPEYFGTLGVPVLTGDLCRRPDPQSQRPWDTTEVMVNRAFVDRYLPGRNVVGLHLGRDTPDRIAGVVGNAREVGLDSDPFPMVYSCGITGNPYSWFFVRFNGNSTGAAELVRARVAELEPDRSVYDMAPLEQSIGEAYAQNRLRTLVLSLFAATALALACLGVYGTLSYVVSLRRREVGLRVALGAKQGDIVAQFLQRALRIVGLAAAIGLALSFAFTRLLSSMLFGVTPSDPPTFVGVILIVASTALFASWLPARRASRLDPIKALREE